MLFYHRFCVDFIVLSFLQENSLLQEGQEKEINMKNDDKRASAFGQYILLLCLYKQQVSIYKGKCNNVGKIEEDPTWWP